MNIDSRVITLSIFLIVQSVGAIWWASGLSSEVGRVAMLVDSKIPALEKEARVCGTEIHNLKNLIADMGDVKSTIKGMDVVLYRLEDIEKSITSLEDIMDRYFTGQREAMMQQQKGG